jgi:hypothetical protein
MLGPLAVYLITVSFLNIRNRPSVISGAVDFTAMGIAIVGFVLIGPMELFFPNTAAMRLGSWVWLLLLVLYFLAVLLFALSGRPRLIIYNITTEQMRESLNSMAERLNLQINWAGDAMTIDQWDIEIHIDANESLRNVSLITGHKGPTWSAWRKFQTELKKTLRPIRGERNIRCVGLLTTGLILTIVVVWVAIHYPEQLVQSARRMFEY